MLQEPNSNNIQLCPGSEVVRLSILEQRATGYASLCTSLDPISIFGPVTFIRKVGGKWISDMRGGISLIRMRK